MTDNNPHDIRLTHILVDNTGGYFRATAWVSDASGMYTCRSEGPNVDAAIAAVKRDLKAHGHDPTRIVFPPQDAALHTPEPAIIARISVAKLQRLLELEKEAQ